MISLFLDLIFAHTFKETIDFSQVLTFYFHSTWDNFILKNHELSHLKLNEHFISISKKNVLKTDLKKSHLVPI